MSTKTTFKRLALVTVAALGLGVLSVAPSNAYTQADTLTLSSTTAAVTTAETATASSAPTATIAFLANAATDSMTVTASLVSAPATATALPYLQLSESTSALVVTSPATLLTANQVAPNTSVFVNTTGGSTGTRVSATFKVYLSANGTAAPTVAGTYVVRLTPAVPVAAQGALSSAAQTITFTVTAAAALDTVVSTATVITNAGETISATTDATISAIKTASNSAAAATYTIATANAAGSTTATAESVTATVTGPGLLGTGEYGSGTTTHSITGVGRSLVIKKGDVLALFPDGTAGTSTVTFTSAKGVVLATKTAVFYGDIAAIVASVSIPVIKVGSTAAVVTAYGYDSAGNVVPGDNLYAYSSDNTIIDTTAYVKSGTSSTTAATFGRATFTLTGVKAGTASIRVGLATGPTDATTTGFAIKSDAVSVRVGGSQNEIADVRVSFDKNNYAPGSVAYVTIQPVDKTGAVLAAGETYTVFSAAVSGTAVLAGLTPSMPVTSVTSAAQISSPSAWTSVAPVALTATAVQVRAGSYAATADVAAVPSGAYTYRMILPVTQGDFTISYSLATMPGNTANSGAARTITATITDPGSQAAVDAATEATDAANAATDAALAAADAADAATAAAEDASAAVATLAKSVNTALDNLKKQITALTALVNKLLKK